MSPVGGSPGRRLRGAPGRRMVEATCTCGTQYQVSASAVDLSVCSNKRCRIPTRNLPDKP